MRLTIIVPAYNVGAYLDDCLKSIVRNESRAFSVLVVDDGSTDGTGAIADAHAASDPRITVLHQSNAGVGAARNAGMDLAGGDFLWFVDGDDLLSAYAVDRLLEAVDDGDDLLLFGYRSVTEKSAADAMCRRAEGEDRPCIPLAEADLRELCCQALHPRRDSALARIPVNSASFTLYRAAFLQQHGIRFDPAIAPGQDGLFNFCALLRAKNARFLDAAFYLYRRNPGSISVRYVPELPARTEKLLAAYAAAIEPAREPDALYRRLACRRVRSLRKALCLDFCHVNNPRPYRARRADFRADWEVQRETGAFDVQNELCESMADKAIYRMIANRMFLPLDLLYRLYTRKWRKRK